MKTVTLVTPDGQDLAEPSEEQVVAAFEANRQDFWLTGSFSGGLYSGEPVGFFGLVFMPTEDAENFVVVFTDTTGEVALAKKVKGPGDVATIQPGAQPFSVPGKWVLPAEAARDAALAFLRRQSRPDLPGHDWDASWQDHPKGVEDE